MLFLDLEIYIMQLHFFFFFFQVESGSGAFHSEILESCCCCIPQMTAFTHSSRCLALRTVVRLELHFILLFFLITHYMK